MSTAGNSERRSAIYVSSEGNITNANASDAKLSFISGVSTDGTLGTNSDALLPTEKAIKTYFDTNAKSHFDVEYYISSSAATTIGVQNQWYKVNATTTTSSFSNANLVHSSPNRLTYSGADVVIEGSVGISFSTASSNQIMEVGMLKNGTIVTPSIAQRKTGVGGDVGHMGFSFHISLSDGDYVEVGIRNTSSATNATAVKMTVDVL